ncbi:MAG TPA: ABC transporter permease [Gemmatimonadales bacterium]|nr:ABC transporter permease [Gemmatimonadales bacterium]
MRFALRSLARHPGFTAVGALTIALAVAGNTAIFAVLKALVLDPLPFKDPGELVTLDVRSSRGFLISNSIPNYRDWGRSRAFQAVGASAGWGMILTGRDQAQVMNLRAVLGDFFGTLGVQPYQGRVFAPAETEPGAEPAIVLGYQFWRTRLGGDPKIVGQTLALDQRPHVVVGILPEGAGFPSPTVEGYVPMGSIPDLPWEDRGSSFGTRAIARLASGMSPALAQQDLDRITAAVEEREGQAIAHPELRTLTDFYVRDLRRQSWVLMAAVGFVLLIAVANVGSLVLVRGEGRRQEIAVRSALGARRRALLRMLLTESLVLSFLGGTLGLGLAYGAVRVLVPLLPSAIPQLLLARIGVDGGVLLFTLALTTTAGLFFGAIPALRASDLEPAKELREGTRGSSRRQRLRSALVTCEVALAMVLLIGAGLMLRSLQNLRSADKGFDAQGVLTARVGLPGDQYPTKERWRAFFDELLPRARALPGVQAAAVSLLLPLSDRSWEMGILPDNVPFDPTRRESVLYNFVTRDYFQTMGIPLLQGRGFTESDGDGSPPVAIIDETMAAKFWPGQDPIGKRVTWEVEEGSTPGADAAPVYRTVVGVVKNIRHYELANPSRIQVYVPMAQTLRVWGTGVYVVLKTDVAPASLVEPLRRELSGMNPDVPLRAVQPLATYVDGDLAGSRVMSVLLATFGAVALALAGVGIFGLVSYSVAQRSREIGIRMALGADAREVLGWIARLGLGLAGTGVAIGVLAAAGLTRLMRTLLYEVSPLDPLLYAALATLLIAVALLATYLPARRAARTDPATVLKREA